MALSRSRCHAGVTTVSADWEPREGSGGTAQAQRRVERADGLATGRRCCWKAARREMAIGRSPSSLDFRWRHIAITSAATGGAQPSGSARDSVIIDVWAIAWLAAVPRKPTSHLPPPPLQSKPRQGKARHAPEEH